MSVGFLAVGFVGTCLSWVAISHFGRRRIYNIGLALLTFIMFLIGILDCAPDYENRPGIIWGQCILLVSQNSIIYHLYATNLKFRLSGMVYLTFLLVPFAMF